ncbi:MAG: AraC family ligand binding domain-containing protein [Clostridiales bacterium]|nr:AraC family ligand binding domain-containing protein [Clostridiales bacterium]
MNRNIIHERFQYQENEAFVVKTSEANINYDDDERIMSHWHEELELVYMVSFGCSHYVEGRCVQSKPGDLVIVNPGAARRSSILRATIRRTTGRVPILFSPSEPCVRSI